MPKKFQGENSKAVQAKARKETAKRDEKERKLKEAEDKLWEDNDKHVLRKAERKEDKEKKHEEKMMKKQEVQKLLEEETKQLKSAKPERVEKINKFEIDKMKEKEAQAQAAAEAARLAALKKIEIINHDDEIVENVNRIQIEGAVARNVDEAIKVLDSSAGASGGPEIDMHPEKRVRAAYLEFEAENLERLKKENPNMRLSQLKQLLKKDWQKSPKNPLNKVFL